jgi:hypothetical protein
MSAIAVGPSGFIVIDKPSGSSFDVIRNCSAESNPPSSVLDKRRGVLVVVPTRRGCSSCFPAEKHTAELWLGRRQTTDDLTGELRQAGSIKLPAQAQLETADTGPSIRSPRRSA